jgi:hypothetical protein
LLIESPLRRLVLGALLWLPACFLLWFALDSVVVWPAGKLAALVLTSWMPNTFAGFEQLGAQLSVETRLVIQAGPDGQLGVLVLTVRPLIYAWSLPLFAGLVAATPLETGARVRQLLIGLPLLWLLVAWGTLFDTLKLLAFDSGPLGLAAVQNAGLAPEAVALGYQFGYLILPAVMPVALWIVMNRQFLEELVAWRREPTPTIAGPNDPAPPPAREPRP